MPTPTRERCETHLSRLPAIPRPMICTWQVTFRRASHTFFSPTSFVAPTVQAEACVSSSAVSTFVHSQKHRPLLQYKYNVFPNIIVLFFFARVLLLAAGLVVTVLTVS